MKVRELIGMLRKMDQGAEVYVGQVEGCCIGSAIHASPPTECWTDGPKKEDLARVEILADDRGAWIDMNRSCGFTARDDDAPSEGVML